MGQHLRCQLWIAVAAAVIFLPNLGKPALWDMDEALYATCTREMFQRGDWVEPRFNGQMFPEKPPLMFWTMMAGFKLFGTSEFAARIFSTVLGIGTALLTFHLGRRLFSARIGFWAGLITVSTIVFTISARAATVDMALTCATTAAFLLFIVGGGCRVAAPGGLSQFSPRKWDCPPLALSCAVPMYACIGLAVLAKGPVGMVLPLGAMGLYLLVADGWRNVLRSAWRMRPFTAIAVVLLVAAPWYVMVGVRTEGEWLRKFFVEFNLRPFSQPIQGHGDTSSMQHALALLVSVLYYFFQIPALLIGFFPWSVFLVPTLAETWRRIRRAELCRNGCFLASCWLGVWFLFWSICKTKLFHYMLPAYPALALLTACLVDRWLAEPAKVRWRSLRDAWLSLILVGLGITIAVPILTAIFLPGEGPIGGVVLGSAGLILVAGGAWCWRQTAGGRHPRAAVGLAVTSVVFLTAIFGFAVLRVDPHQNAKAMMAAIRADGGAPSATPLATYRFLRESTVFYANRPADQPVAVCDSAEQLSQFLAHGGPAYVITTDEYLAELGERFPGVFREVFRQPRFLASTGEMVVLGVRQESVSPGKG